MADSDSDGFTVFVESASQSLLRSAWLLTGDAASAEDLLQTALARMWPRWNRIAAGGNPEAYLRRMLYTSYLSWWRRRWKDEISAAAPPERAASGDLVADLASRDTIRRALARLPRRQRAVVVLRFVEDRSVAETARILGCSPGTVKTHTSRALETLRSDPALALCLEGA